MVCLWQNKENPVNERASLLFGKPVHGDALLIDTYYIDTDDQGRLIEGFEVYCDATLEVYNNLIKLASNRASAKTEMFGVYKMSLPLEERDQLKEWPASFNSSLWKGKSPKSMVLEYAQASRWKTKPKYVHLSKNQQGYHKVKIVLENLNKEFASEGYFRQVKDAEHAAALEFLRDLTLRSLNGEVDTALQNFEEDDSVQSSEGLSKVKPNSDKSHTGFKPFDSNLPVETVVPDEGVLKQVIRSGSIDTKPIERSKVSGFTKV